MIPLSYYNNASTNGNIITQSKVLENACGSVITFEDDMSVILGGMKKNNIIFITKIEIFFDRISDFLRYNGPKLKKEIL